VIWCLATPFTSARALLRQPDAAHEVLEARFGAQAVVPRSIEELDLEVVLPVGAFERLKGGYFVVQSVVKDG